MSGCGGEAQRYARQFGWHMLPIDPATKRPAFRHRITDEPDEVTPWDGAVTSDSVCLRGECGYKHASDDPDLIKRWWAEMPEAWCGVSLAASGLCAVDIDPRNGGRPIPGLPPTWEAATAGGGWHHLYRVAEGTELPHDLGPGIDVKHHGYVLCAPTPGYRWLLSPPLAAWGGKTYKAKVDYDGPRAAEYDGPTEASPAAVQYLKRYGERLAAACEVGAGRNDALYVLARSCGQLVAGGEMKKQETLAWLDGLGPALGLSRTKSTIRSGWRKGLTKDKPVTLTETIDGRTFVRVAP